MPDIRSAITDRPLDRRSFLSLAAVGAAGALLPTRVFAAAVPTAAFALADAPDRSLSFVHTHTQERLEAQYCSAGAYVRPALADVNHLLRDFRVNAVKPIDTDLLDLLFLLHTRLGTSQPFHVISCYRTPETNAMLQERGGTHSGVASHSLHIEGRAIDIRVPGVDLQHLRDTARALQMGGVGYYASSDFVHVDTGRVRYW